MEERSSGKRIRYPTSMYKWPDRDEQGMKVKSQRVLIARGDRK